MKISEVRSSAGTRRLDASMDTDFFRFAGSAGSNAKVIIIC